MFNRPDDCAPIARAASINRTVRGWVSGVLTPSLNSNSAAALEGLLKMDVAQAADVAPSRFLRVIFILLVSRARYRAWKGVSAEPPSSARHMGARQSSASATHSPMKPI